MDKKQSRRFSLLINEAFEKDIEVVMEKTNIGDIANVIRYCVSFTRSKLIPEYVAVKSTASARQKYSNPEERVKAQLKRKQEEDEAKRAIAMERGLNICTTLGGEIIDQENGFKACKFTLYEKVGKRLITGERTIPLDNLNESHIEAQYKGGAREEVLELLNKSPQ